MAALSEVVGLVLLFWLLFSTLASFFTSLTASHASLQLHEPRSSLFTSEKTTRGRLETELCLFIARDLAPRHTGRLPFQAREGAFGFSRILRSLSYLCHPGCLSWQNGYPLTIYPTALEGRTIRCSAPGWGKDARYIGRSSAVVASRLEYAQALSVIYLTPLFAVQALPPRSSKKLSLKLEANSIPQFSRLTVPNPFSHNLRECRETANCCFLGQMVSALRRAPRFHQPYDESHFFCPAAPRYPFLWKSLRE